MLLDVLEIASNRSLQLADQWILNKTHRLFTGMKDHRMSFFIGKHSGLQVAITAIKQSSKETSSETLPHIFSIGETLFLSSCQVQAENLHARLLLDMSNAAASNN